MSGGRWWEREEGGSTRSALLLRGPLRRAFRAGGGSNLINDSEAAHSSLSHIRPETNPAGFLQLNEISFIHNNNKFI